MSTKSVAPKSNSENVNCIIKALKDSLPDLGNTEITADTQFQGVPSFDSMAVVNFQAELSKSIGDKAFDVTPMMEMSIEQYADLLE